VAGPGLRLNGAFTGGSDSDVRVDAVALETLALLRENLNGI
jgi:hypothetical protein